MTTQEKIAQMAFSGDLLASVDPSEYLASLLKQRVAQLKEEGCGSQRNALLRVQELYGMAYNESAPPMNTLHAWYSGRRKNPAMDVGLRLLYLLMAMEDLKVDD